MTERKKFSIIDFDPLKNTDRIALYRYVSQRLADDGITREEYDSLRHLPTVGHHSVGSLLEPNLRLGSLEWRNEKIFNVYRKATPGLTRREENKLHRRAQELGLSSSELILRFINKGLSEND